MIYTTLKCSEYSTDTVRIGCMVGDGTTKSWPYKQFGLTNDTLWERAASAGCRGGDRKERTDERQGGTSFSASVLSPSPQSRRVQASRAI